MEESFKNIKKLRAHIKDMFLNLTAKKDVVSSYYIQYVEKNKKNKMFGLDSFHFQSKLIELEYKHLHDEYLFMDNRIYCDYYKLYGMVATFCKQNFKTDYKFVNYPVYKDLDPYRAYDFETINNIHYNIIDLIQFIQTSIKNGEDEINRDKNRLKTGLNLENYIHNLEYRNNILISNVQLYENYLNSYHIYHMNFLKKLSDKISLFWKQLSNNMQVNDETLSEEFREIKENDTELKTADELLKNEIVNQLIEPVSRTNSPVIEFYSENVDKCSEFKNNINDDCSKLSLVIEEKTENLNNMINELKDESQEQLVMVQPVKEETEEENEENEENEEEPRQRCVEDSRETETKESNPEEESVVVSSTIDETRETSDFNLYIKKPLDEPLLLEEEIYEKQIYEKKEIKEENKEEINEEINEEKEELDNVHITPDFINENKEEDKRDSAVERDAMIPEVCVENILNNEFVGIKESSENVVVNKKNKKKKKRN